jgi:hypothetical protein
MTVQPTDHLAIAWTITGLIIFCTFLSQIAVGLSKKEGRVELVMRQEKYLSKAAPAALTATWMMYHLMK